MIIRNIREFTVAVSDYLKEENWLFDSKFSRFSGMDFTIKSYLQGKQFHVCIVPGSEKPFRCFLKYDDEIIYEFELAQGVDVPIDIHMKEIVKLLNEIRDEVRTIK